MLRSERRFTLPIRYMPLTTGMEPLLLAPGQNGYTVLGEFYTELRIVKDVGITVGAKGYDTPLSTATTPA